MLAGKTTIAVLGVVALHAGAVTTLLTASSTPLIVGLAVALTAAIALKHLPCQLAGQTYSGAEL